MARPLPALRIRRALPSDLPSILALDRDLMGPTYAPTVASTVAWWVATSDGQVAAYASAHRSASWVDCVYLARAGVALPFQGRGLQRRLIRARERWARAWGAAWAITDTSPDNAPSANNLYRAGYRVFAPTKPWAGPLSLYFRRRIA